MAVLIANKHEDIQFFAINSGDVAQAEDAQRSTPHIHFSGPGGGGRLLIGVFEYRCCGMDWRREKAAIWMAEDSGNLTRSTRAQSAMVRKL